MATSTIPIVFLIGSDPVKLGLVASLNQPGGNVTGVYTRWTEITAKQVEVLQEAFPERNRLGVLWDALSADQFSAVDRESKARGLAVLGRKLENPPYDFVTALRAEGLDERALRTLGIDNPRRLLGL